MRAELALQIGDSRFGRGRPAPQAEYSAFAADTASCHGDWPDKVQLQFKGRVAGAGGQTAVDCAPECGVGKSGQDAAVYAPIGL